MTDAAPNRLPDEDVRAAMRAMSGYIDITTEDFREIYELAHEHALKRLFAKMDVPHLMRRDLSALRPDQSLTEAAEQMALMHAHTLPVVDESGLVLGDVSEWNFLRGYGADTFFSLGIPFDGARSAFHRVLPANHRGGRHDPAGGHAAGTGNIRRYREYLPPGGRKAVAGG